MHFYPWPSSNFSLILKTLPPPKISLLPVCTHPPWPVHFFKILPGHTKFCTKYTSCTTVSSHSSRVEPKMSASLNTSTQNYRQSDTPAKWMNSLPNTTSPLSTSTSLKNGSPTEILLNPPYPYNLPILTPHVLKYQKDPLTVRHHDQSDALPFSHIMKLCIHDSRGPRPLPSSTHSQDH